MKYPIGIQDFEQIINDGYVYVDKTDLIYQLVTTGKIYFLSRPRRFGKSVLVSTLECYFQGNTELFSEYSGKQMLLEDQHREILKGFYSVFKAADKDLQFVLLTGVTKFSQVSVFSGFNQPADISMDGRYEALCGITAEELHHYFAEPIQTLAQKYQYTEEEMKAFLKKQYDGYHFGENLIDIYNPFSILNAFSAQKVDDYWFRSGTPSYLIRLMNHTEENLNELTGKYYDTSEFIDYKADVEKPLPMIYQSGYLTVKGFDREMNTYLLDFPNNEVKKGFVTMVANDYLKTKNNA